MALQEDVTINLQFTPQALTRHRHDIEQLMSPPATRDGDLLNIRYKFCIKYFGNIRNALAAVSSICDDPSVVKSVSCAELTQGRILIHEVLKKLEELIKKVG